MIAWTLLHHCDYNKNMMWNVYLRTTFQALSRTKIENIARCEDS